MSDGHKCYPLCADCITDGKDVVKHGKQDKMQAKKTRQQNENSRGEIKRRAEEQEQCSLWCAMGSKHHSFSAVRTLLEKICWGISNDPPPHAT